MWGAKPFDVGGRFWCEADFENLNWWARSWSNLVDLLPWSTTWTKYWSAHWINAESGGAVLPNLSKWAMGSALRAPLFEPILLVMLHPVRLWSAGRTEHIREPNLACNVWRGSMWVVLPLPTLTHSSWSPSWRKVVKWYNRAITTSVSLDMTRHIL